MTTKAAAPRTVMMGLGYIGLPTAAVIARSGSDVLGVDIRSDVVDTINAGRIHIEEPDLADLVRDVVGRGKLRASLVPEPADVFVIAVPTPFDADHAPDTSMVMDAGRRVAPFLAPGSLVLLESTSPVGTTEELVQVLAAERPDLSFPQRGTDSDTAAADVSVAYCPERVLPGKILRELIANDRIIGGVSARCSERARAFYRRVVDGECLVTDSRSAELVKLSENAFRDVNIAFANELSIVADRLEIDVWQVIALANRHPRVDILNPGPGVGGHCIAVDPWFIVHSAPEHTPLIQAARHVNDGKVGHTVERARAVFGECEGPVGVLGIAFKADIDDFRESPSLRVAELLAEEFGDRMILCEPHMAEMPDSLRRHDVQACDFTETLSRCQGLVLLVDHKEFREASANALRGKVIYDTRGCWIGRDA